jgi:hypothetical protein
MQPNDKPFVLIGPFVDEHKAGAWKGDVGWEKFLRGYLTLRNRHFFNRK